MDYETKDSGERAEYPSGMVRDTEVGKIRPDLIPEIVTDAIWPQDRRVIEQPESVVYHNFQDVKYSFGDTDLEIGKRMRALISSIVELESQRRPYGREQFHLDLAGLYARGAVKYTENNWKLANTEEEYKRFIRSGERHLLQFLAGDDSEAHHCAIVFNLTAAYYTRGNIDVANRKSRL